MINIPMIMTGMPIQTDWSLGTGWIQLKKSTAFPTTVASMNMAIPIGSFKRISIRRISRETATAAFPYRIPSVLEMPRFSTSQGAAPRLAWMVR